MSTKNERVEQIKSEELPFSETEWEQTPSSVQEFILGLKVRIQALESQVTELKERVNRNSSNSAQPPSSDGPQKDKKSRGPVEKKRQTGGQAGHQGHSRKIVPLEQLKASYDLKPEICQGCGEQLAGEDPKPYRHQVTEIPVVVAEVTEYRLHTINCDKCGSQSRGLLPTGVPKGAFGPRLQAMVSLLSGHYHLSKRDTSGIMTDFFGTKVSLGSVPTLEQRTSEAIVEAVNEAQDYLKRQAVVHLDETGWFERHQRAWLWVATTSLVTVFFIRSSRGGQVVREILEPSYTGIVVSDRWSAYNWLLTLLRQLCWAHLLRDFQAFTERGGQSQLIGQALLAQAQLMFTWWHKVRDGTLSFTTFQEKMLSVQHNVIFLLRLGSTCDQSKTAATCRNILKLQAALWTFVRVPGVEPTNNLAERVIRPAVLWRKRSFGTHSQAGSRFVERIMSVVSTLKLQQRNVLNYLTQACDAANSGKPPPSLLPALSAFIS